MKQFLFILLTSGLLLAACSNPDGSGKSIPESPAEQRALLQQKKEQLQLLQEEITKLEDLLGVEAGKAADGDAKLVTTLKLEKTLFRRFSEIQGNVTPVKSNTISSETGGRLIRIAVREGDVVKAGQLLATVDMEPIQKQLQELETSMELATDVYNRQKRLWEQKIGSEMQYLQAKNTKERLEKSMESLKSQLKKANIYAPISGVIEELINEQGDVAAPGMPIMHLINTTNLKVVAEVPERYVGTVKQNDNVKIKVPALSMEQEAKIALIGKVVHTTNRTFKLETTLDNRQGLLKPNLLALVYIEDYREPNALVISVDLVQEEVGGKKFVFIAAKDGELQRAKKVYVTTGESYDNQIVIKEGLNPGDEIIVLGSRGLNDNALLEVQKANHE